MLPSEKIPQDSHSTAELLAVSALLVVIVLIQILVTRSGALFTHALWLDEILTWTIANDPNFTHAISAVKGGVETNPPTMQVILWPIARLSGGLNEAGLRVFSFASTVFGLIAIYATCRSCFGKLPSLIGTLVLAAHPLIIRHMFEARFYAPWLAATVCYAWALHQLTSKNQSSPPRLAAACIFAVLAATMHYFGIIAVLLISITSLLLYRRALRFSNFLPVILAIVASLGCIPFVLGQRAGMNVLTWIEPTSLSDVKDVLIQVLAPPSLIMVIVLAWIWRVMRGASDASETRSRELRILAPITSLLLFPLFVIAFSYVIQPAAKERYLIVATAPLGCLAAYVASRAAPWMAIAMLIGLFVVGSAEIFGRARAVRGAQRDLIAMIDQIESDAKPDQPIIFKRRVEMYPLARLRPDLLARSSLLDFDTSLDSRVRDFSIYERDMARKFAAFYHRYSLVNIRQIAAGQLLVVPAHPLERDEIKQLLTDWDVESSGGWTLRIKSR